MATSNQSKKRMRQSEKRRLRNKSLASTYRTLVKRLLDAAKAGDEQKAKALLPETVAQIDKAAKSRVIHPNTAARRKSLVARAVGGIGKKAAPAKSGS
jgi:small subunit ribosomal protein S20